jgi:hypothetical protein
VSSFVKAPFVTKLRLARRGRGRNGDGRIGRNSISIIAAKRMREATGRVNGRLECALWNIAHSQSVFRSILKRRGRIDTLRPFDTEIGDRE